MSRLTWRQLLQYIAYFFAAVAVVGIGYTLYQWILNPTEGQWEPLNVLADNALSVFTGIASLVALQGSRSAPDTPIKIFQAPPKDLEEENWRRNRENVLNHVKTVWVDGFLKKINI